MCLQFILFYLLVSFEVTAAWVRCGCVCECVCVYSGCVRLNRCLVRKRLDEDVVCGFHVA